MARVSVIIPTYNRSGVLPRAIDSVLNQTYNKFEIIVVDDGSSDNTQEIMESYSDNRIKYVYHETNKGANAARNEGVRRSSGKYISYLDSDDWFLPDYLQKVVDTLDGSPDTIAGAFTGFKMMEGGSVRFSKSHKGVFKLSHLLPGNSIGTFSVSTFKKDIYNHVGYPDEQMESAQDLDFYIRVLDKYNMIGIDSYLVGYDMNTSGISDNMESKISGQEALINKHESKLTGKDMSEIYLSRGKSYAQNGRVCDGISSFIKSIRFNPFDWKGYYHVLFLMFGSQVFNIGLNLKKKVSSILRVVFK